MRYRIVAALLLLASPASAYKFRNVYDEARNGHFLFATGAAVDTASPGQTKVATLIPLVYHSHTDGYWLLPGEDWALLDLGVGINHGDLSVEFGPSFNLLPGVQKAGLKLLDLIAEPGTYNNLRDIMTPIVSGQDMSIAVSPQVVRDLSAGKWGWAIFTGPQWKF